MTKSQCKKVELMFQILPIQKGTFKALVSVIYLGVSCLTGCTSARTATVTVTSSSGAPITGASVVPSPIRIGRSNISNSKGELEIVELYKDHTYEIWADGYESKEIGFPKSKAGVRIILQKKK